MRKLLFVFGITLITFTQAATIYTEDFTTVASETSSGFLYLGNTLVSEEFHLAGNTSISTDPGAALVFTDPGHGNRFRGAGVWIDTSAVTAGYKFTVTFDVTAFTGATGATSAFQAYGVNNIAGIGSGTGTAGFDLQLAALPPDFDLTGGATGGEITGANASITTTATDVTVSFINTGGGYDAVGLFFLNTGDGTTSGSGKNNTFSIDNLALDAAVLPEPSSLALLLLASSSCLFMRSRKHSNKKAA